MTERSHLGAPVAVGASTLAKGKQNLNLDSNFLTAGRDIGNIVFMKCSHDLCETVANAVLYSDTPSTVIEEHDSSPDSELDESVVDEDSNKPQAPSISRKTTNRRHRSAVADGGITKKRAEKRRKDDLLAKVSVLRSNDLDDVPIAGPSNSNLISIQAIPTDDRREFLCTEALSRAPSSCEVYVKRMYKLNHGYPLWYPQPDRARPVEYRRKGVSVGDVGVITFDGAFDFLFNIWSTNGAPNIQSDVPGISGSTGTLPGRRTMVQHLFNPSYNNKISNFKNLVAHPNSDSSEVTFTLKDSNKGALLWIPHGASTENLVSENQLRKFISKNALDWYRYANDDCGIDLDRHSLYLVTGYTKSKTWGIATFDKSNKHRNTTLSVSKSNDTNSPYWTWVNCGEATHTRTGPYPDPELETENGIQVDENQCLFLRGFKISLSEVEWDNILHPPDATEDSGRNNDSPSFDRSHEPRRDNRSNGSYGAGSSTESQNFSGRNSGNNVKIETFPEKGALFHPLTAINNALLSQFPDARIAVTHDNMWSTLVSQACADSGLDVLVETIKNEYVIGFDKDTDTCTFELGLNRSPDDESQSRPALSLSTIADIDRSVEHMAPPILLTNTDNPYVPLSERNRLRRNFSEAVARPHHTTTHDKGSFHLMRLIDEHRQNTSDPEASVLDVYHHIPETSFSLTAPPYQPSFFSRSTETRPYHFMTRDNSVMNRMAHTVPESAFSVTSPPHTQSLLSSASSISIRNSVIQNAGRNLATPVNNAPEDTPLVESSEKNQGPEHIYRSDGMFAGAHDFLIPDQYVSAAADPKLPYYSDNGRIPAMEQEDDSGDQAFSGVRNFIVIPSDHLSPVPDTLERLNRVNPHVTDPSSMTEHTEGHHLTPPREGNPLFSDDGYAPQEGDGEKNS